MKCDECGNKKGKVRMDFDMNLCDNCYNKINNEYLDGLEQ
jgi:hypothetical protein